VQSKDVGGEFWLLLYTCNYDGIGEEARMSRSLIEEETHATFRRGPRWKPACLWCDGKCLTSFSGRKTKRALTERALGYLVTTYAMAAHLASVSPHDLWHRFGFRMAEQVPLHRLAQLWATIRWRRPGSLSRIHRKICNIRLRPVRGWNSIPTRISRREEKDIIF
jgi:hypothetical protein